MDRTELVKLLETPCRAYGRVELLDEVVKLYVAKDTEGMCRLYTALVRAQHLKPNPAKDNEIATYLAVEELEETCAAADAYWPHRHEEHNNHIGEYAFSLGGTDQEPGEIRTFFRKTLDYKVAERQT